MIYLLTQNNCPKCEALKMFLQRGLDNKYEAYIEIVHRQANESLFLELSKKYAIMQTPCFLAEDGSVLRNPSLTEIEDFLKSKINK